MHDKQFHLICVKRFAADGELNFVRQRDGLIPCVEHPAVFVVEGHDENGIRAFKRGFAAHGSAQRSGIGIQIKIVDLDTFDDIS